MHDEPSQGETSRDAQPRRVRPGLRAALTALVAGPVAVSLAVVLLVDPSQRLVAAAAALGLSVLLAHRLAGRLLQPLAPLRESLERLGRGEVGRPLTVLDDNEFGQLADQVNGCSSRASGWLIDGFCITYSAYIRSSFAKTAMASAISSSFHPS